MWGTRYQVIIWNVGGTSCLHQLSILCLKALSATQLKQADILLLQYWKRVERTNYGAEANMHFTCHLIVLQN